MASYFNRNLKILRKALEKKRGRILDMDIIAALSGFSSIKLQSWERDGNANLSELKKLVAFYSRVLEMELTLDQINNRDLRYDKRFADIAWKSM